MSFRGLLYALYKRYHCASHYCRDFLLRMTMTTMMATMTRRTTAAITMGNRAGAETEAIVEALEAAVRLSGLKTAAVLAKLWEMTSAAESELSAYASS